MDVVYVEIAKTTVGPFVGALLAFISVRVHDSAKRYRENLAAGNLALFAIQSQYNDFLLFRKNFYVEVNRNFSAIPNIPIWLLLRPAFITFAGLKINFESLGYLFERAGRFRVFENLNLAQLRYQDMEKLTEFMNDNGREIQKIVESVHKKFPHDPAFLQRIDEAVGPQLKGVMHGVVVGVGLRATKDEESYTRAFSELAEALRKEFSPNLFQKAVGFFLPKRWFPWGNVPELPDLRLSENFHKESLPKLPEPLMQEVEVAAQNRSR
ncbi:MAG: hypothetical protein KGI47_06265 [Betaproteobacteria bacterium]|nr:hypothetical protein [Betaproteobacteria bacterium]MDE2621919.1 hypothetical protein [Betaproteobacteria bacterium]